MYKLISDYFSRNKLLHSSLYMYRGGKSTMTALLTMYDKWVKVAGKGQVSGVVLVNFIAAFNLVYVSLLIQNKAAQIVFHPVPTGSACTARLVG